MSGVSVDRRAHRRVDLPATAVVVKGGVDAGRFTVANLSPAGALLTGNGDVDVGDALLLRLEVLDRRPFVLSARVVRRAPAAQGLTALAVEFRHKHTETEDQIQDAILGVLEEEVKSQPFFKDADFYAE
jgi:hypothetical protein